MKRSPGPMPRALAAIAACTALLAPAVAGAQDARPAARPPAVAGTPDAKPAAKPPAAKPAAGAPKRAANVPPPTTAEQMAALPDADEAQRKASELVHYGKYVCDDKWEIFVERNPVFEHYVDVRYKRDVWVMKPVASATGAVRLEDPRGRVLLVQIPVKSMLLNTQTGQRIVDSCQHDHQKEAESQAKADAAATASAAKQ